MSRWRYRLVSGGYACSWLARLRGSNAGTLTLDEREDTAEAWRGDLLVDGSVEEGFAV